MFITSDEDLAEAVGRMRAAGTDLAEYEVKSAAGGAPKGLPDSVSSFANTSGGTIVLGLVEKNGFKPANGFDPKVAQAGLVQAARELVEPPQSPEILVLRLEGSPVVVANVQEAPVREKPCYVKRQGMMGGSYIRTGAATTRWRPTRSTASSRTSTAPQATTSPR